MYISSIKLKNYRNYKSADFELSPAVNIFYGDNAQGKTNILEAVYLCATTRSHRGSKDKEMIALGEEEAHICVKLVKEPLTHRIDLHLKNNKAKGIAIDSIPIRKTSELLGFMHVVFFSPEDLSIIKNGPAYRRKFIDLEMGQLDGGYLQLLIQYNKLLSERNNLLKQIITKPSWRETLYVWDEQLIEKGSEIIKKRQAFIRLMDDIIRDIHYTLTGGKEHMELVYDKYVSVDDYPRVFNDNMDRDLRTGSTNVGPHRDDLSFIVNGMDLRRFGSQGQQRTAALSLKLAEIQLIEQISGKKPVLLLDDVLSELDHNRQQFLLDSISGIQTLISCTGIEDFIKRHMETDRIYLVEKGKIKEYNITSDC